MLRIAASLPFLRLLWGILLIEDVVVRGDIHNLRQKMRLILAFMERGPKYLEHFRGGWGGGNL